MSKRSRAIDSNNIIDVGTGVPEADLQISVTNVMLRTQTLLMRRIQEFILNGASREVNENLGEYRKYVAGQVNFVGY